MFRFVLRMLGGRGEFRKVIFAGAELFCFPSVAEGHSILFGVTENFAKLDVVIGAVDGCVDGVGPGELVMGPEWGIF